MVGSFLLCEAAADEHGGHGCTLALNLSIPWVNKHGSPFKIQSGAVAIAHAEPRILIVKITSPACNACVCVAHGPLATSKDECFRPCWPRLECLCGEHANGLPMILLTDANATAARPDGIHLGDLAKDKWQASSTSFSSFLRGRKLWVPATFDTIDFTVRGTFACSKYKNERIDFVAASMEVHAIPNTSAVLMDFMMPTASGIISRRL